MKSLKRVTRASLGALVLGFCVAPSCTALPVSQTMIVLQTDLSLPKDVDKVTIEVLVRGDRRHFNTFEKLGNQDSLKIPASLGLTLADGTDPSTPITFRVTAFQGASARVLREVITTIPKDRLVALKLPIQWLCWDQVMQDDNGNPQSTCPEGQTCIAGTCADKTVDPTSLEDYAADKVFGGGTGTDNDGTCFDTTTCFGDGKDAPVDLEACTITASDEMNVAIRVDSAGICGAAGCFVPIDAKSEFGWKAGASGTIQLPLAVCKRIKAGSAAGVSVVGASTACPLKTNGIPTCGPWSSAGTAPPALEELGPVTLIANQVQPVSLAVAAGNVYWTVAGPYTAPEGVVKRMPITGGSASIVQAAQAYPRDIAVITDTTGKLANLVWASAGITKTDQMVPEGATVTDRSFADPAKPTDVKLNFNLPLGSPEGVAADANGVFFTDFGANAVYRVSTTGMTLLAGPSNGTGQNRPYRIAVDKTRAYWTNEGNLNKNDGSITLCNFNDPLPSPLAAGQDVPRNLVIDIDASTALATAVYWTNYGKSGSEVSQKVMMVSLADPTNVKAIATGNQPSGIALDKDAVYWTNQGDNTVMKRNKADGSTHVVAQKQNVPGAIAVDTTHIYWINEGGSGTPGSIMRISKAAPEPK